MNYRLMLLGLALAKRVKSGLASLKRDTRGQNTVEYGLMLLLVVGVALAAGAAMKRFMPQLFSQIQGMITGAAGKMGAEN